MAMSSGLFLCWHRAAGLFEPAHGSKALLGFLWWYRVEGFFSDITEQHGALAWHKVARLFVLAQNSRVFCGGTEQHGWLLWLTSTVCGT